MADIDRNIQSKSFAFEHVAAKLIPFDLDRLAQAASGAPMSAGQIRSNVDNRTDYTNSDLNAQGNRTQRTARRLGPNMTTNLQGSLSQRNHPLSPIVETLGLVFPYNPSISEKISVKYDSIDLTHTNENYYAYKGTDNVRITISNAVWTCDTFENAVYALAVQHFFRSYSYMDFGAPRASNSRPTGRPPSPMWFSAYGEYAWNRVPVLLESADWSFPNDIDYVGIPQPGTSEWASRVLLTKKQATDHYTWMPMKFEIGSISLIVQHSPLYWINWNLEDFRSGAMVRRDGGQANNRGGFHRLPRTEIIR